MAGIARTDRLRVAVVGLGWAARTIWLPLLRDHPAFEVAAVADPDPAARGEAAVDGARSLADTRQLSAADSDLAVLAVPNHLHATIGCALLDRGISVFVEKPVCLSAAEALRLAAAERRGQAVLLAGSAARYRSDITALATVTRSLEPVRHLELSWIRAHGIPAGAGWFTHRRLAGGGAFIDLGWHLLDIGLLLLGAAGVADVAGTWSADFLPAGTSGAAWRGDRPGGPGHPDGDVEDTAHALLVTDDGVSIGLTVSWASHFARDVTQIVVEGRAGVARLDCTFGYSPNRVPDPALTVFRAGREYRTPLSEDPVGIEYRRQVDALPSLLAEPASRGRAIAEAARTAVLVERFYRLARRAAAADDAALGAKQKGA
jgi:oxidoreductase